MGEQGAEPLDPSVAPTVLARPSIPSLDGLRAVSFMIVFLGHAGLGHIVPGGFGVTIFFFLSGYLITTLMRVEIANTSAINYRFFYLRRAFRILPSYYLVFALAMLATTVGLIGGRVTLGSTLSQLFYFNNYWQIFHGSAGQPAGTGVYWSLAVEEHFYLIFPVVFVAIVGRWSRGATQAKVIAVLCGAVLLWRCVLFFGLHVSVERIYYATDTRIDSILFGCALAVFCNPVLDRPVRVRWLRWAVPLAAVVLAVTFVVRSDAFRETLRYSLQGLALVPIFILVITQANHPTLRWLNHPAVKWAGRMTYGAYLWHYIVIDAVERNLSLPLPAAMLLALVVTFVLAEILDRLVDRPMAKMRARYRS